MQVRRFAWLWAICVALAPATAGAYEIKKSSSGAPVHWTIPEVAFVPALTPGPSSVPTDDATVVLAASAATWRAALADSAVSVVAASTTATPANHVNDGVNTVRWAMAQGDPDIERGVLALTFVAYRASDGVVSDADVVLNAVDFAWTTDAASCMNAYDLESALTHELGHALGMAHSVGHADATMFATGEACEILKRDLSSDDVEGIVALYPPPMEVGMDPESGGCSTGGHTGVVVALAALLLVRRRRWCVAASLVLAIGAPAEASQLRRLALGELGRDAVMVVRGHVVAVTPERGAAIETASEIVVDECLRGACPATVRVVRRGGERDGQALWVDGEAAPAVGSEIVVYLRRDAQGRLRVLGGVQGLLRVIDTPVGRFALRDLRGHHVLADGAWSDGGVEPIRLATLARALR